MMPDDKKQKIDALHVINTFIKMIRLGMPGWICCLLGVTVIGLGSYLFNLLIGLILSTTLEHFEAGTSAASTIFLITGFLFLATVFMAGGYVFNLYGAMGIRAKIQRRLVSVWVRLTESFASKRHSSESMSIITSDMDILEDFYFQGLMNALFIPLVQGIASVVTIAAINWRLLLPPVITGVISLLVNISFSGRVQETNRTLRRAADQLTQSFQETVRGNVTWRMLGTTDGALDSYRQTGEFYTEKAAAPKRLKANIKFVEELLSAVSTIVFLGISIWLTTKGSLTFASVMLVYPLINCVGEMMNSFGGTWNFIVTATTSGERVMGALDWPREDISDSIMEPEQDISSLSFQEVSFGYDQEKPVLKGISFQIKPGQTIALVGDSGGGKSTILQLLLRFYDPDQGSVEMKGKNAKEYSLDAWRANIVYLEQNAPLLSKTVRENIAMGLYGRGRNPSEEEIMRAARAAGAHEFIMDLPEGYDTHIDERGGNLSGGQRQRIALARAFLNDAPILLLDEPTAALDAESERVIQQSLESIMKERTVVVVAHRLETIRNADLILVLNNGKIEEQGSHQDLLTRNGLYARLYSKQEKSSA